MLRQTSILRAAPIVLMGALLLSLISCSESASPQPRAVTADQPLRIVTTIQPLKLIVQDLLDKSVREFVTLDVLLTPDQSPHGFEPSPSQVATLQRADVVVINGLGLDDWAKRAAANDATVIVFADVVGIDAHDHHHHHHDHDDHHDCDHHHGPVDEHLWLDPVLVKRFAAQCATELAAALAGAPDHERVAADLESAAARFAEQADSINDAYRQQLSPHANRRIVTHHNVFSRITDRYGLGEPIVLQPLATLEPSAGDLRQAIEAIREDSITTIFIEPQFHTAAAQRIREETGVELLQVDPHGAQASSWPAFMHELLDALVKGLAEGSTQ